MSSPWQVSRNRVRRLISALLISTISVSVAWADENALKDEIGEILTEEGLTGAAWMLISENGAPDLGAVGFSDNKNKSSFTTDTRFHVGSVTKNLLSIGILRLATTGMVGLDESIESYLPNLQFDNPWRGIHDVTA